MKIMKRILEWFEINLFNIHRDANSTIRILISTGNNGQIARYKNMLITRWCVEDKHYYRFDLDNGRQFCRRDDSRNYHEPFERLALEASIFTKMKERGAIS